MEGNGEVEAAAFAYRAINPDSSAMSIDDALGDVQPHAEPAPVVFSTLPETLEHRLGYFRGNS